MPDASVALWSCAIPLTESGLTHHGGRCDAQLISLEIVAEPRTGRGSTTSAPHVRALGMPGYSGTPLAQKLGLVSGTTVHAIGAPADYKELLAPIPPDVAFTTRVSKSTRVIHLFTTSRAELSARLEKLRTSIAPDAAVWVSWPKKSAKVPTDVTEDVIRAVALPMGFVDVKVCAVSDVWSGLKLVIRKELR